MTIAENLKNAILQYELALKNKLKESVIDDLFDAAEDIVPNSRLNDLYFYPERERSVDQIVEEAIARQRLYEQGGIELVLRRVKEQAEEVIISEVAQKLQIENARQLLRDVTNELKELG